MTETRQYSDVMLDSKQSAYGKGFLSPGGAREVRTILQGLNITDKDVLDIGCGVGGAMVIMARDMGARHVLGVDVESENLRRAEVTLREEGLAERTALRQIDPGPLPFDDRSFDFIYSNDVVCHIQHKNFFFAEVRRILRSGGCFVAGDWMVGEADNPVYLAWTEKLRAGGLIFHFESPGRYQAQLLTAGFDGAMVDENSEWAQDVAAAQLAEALGPGREEAIASLGEAAYERRCQMTEARLKSLENGSLRHGIMRAVRIT